jgi:hypothetical protein
LAECLIAGRTRAEAADLDPAVDAEVDQLRDRSGETRVADVLLGLLESDDDRIVLGAAREIYRWKIQRAPVEPEPEPEREVKQGYILVRQEPFR